jgi:hypothetical protein
MEPVAESCISHYDDLTGLMQSARSTMTKTAGWLAKSLLAGTALGLATFAISYGFLVVHPELGLHPTVSYGAAMLAFACGTIVALIYFRIREGG